LPGKNASSNNIKEEYQEDMLCTKNVRKFRASFQPDAVSLKLPALPSNPDPSAAIPLETRNSKLLFRGYFGSGKKVGNERENRLLLNILYNYNNMLNKLKKCRKIINQRCPKRLWKSRVAVMAAL
jgi:hypothetical protein